jgi:type I restriction enzyme S subunit
MNLTTVKQILLAAPPTKAEQEAIAEALSDADALIESLEQLVAKKRQIKQGTMQALLTGKQRLPGFNDEWQRCHLADLVAFHKGKGLPKSALDAFAQTPCIHYGELFTQYAETIREVTSYTGQVADALFSYVQDVLMPTSDVTPTGLAKASCVTMKDVVLGGDILVIRPDTRRLFGPFLSYVIRYSKQQILQLVTGSTVFHIYASDMKKFTLAVPSIKEQEQIILVLDDMDTELVELETRLAKTRQLKQGMMQELLTGRIRLVQPALNVVPLPEKKETRAAAASPHNRQINEAVVIAALVKQFGSEDWPLARVRRTKLTYLLHRHAEGRADGFLKKAAGPYDPRTRYKGPEGIALKKGYVQALHNGTYEGFVASEHISEAETYFEKWYGTDVMDWLERFRLRKTDELELLTTVDMAMEDLRREGKPISVEAVRQLIHGHPEWKPKLERAIFSDDGIAAAIAECQALFAS